MKIFTRVAFVLGLAALCVLVIRNDIQSIASLLRQAGWLLLCLVPLHCVPLGLDVMGWRVLLLERSRFATLFVIASIREAINRLLPVANVGGEVVGARLLVLRGISYPAAVGSILVETALNILSQILFLILGLACLFHTTDRFELTGALIMAVAGAATIACCCSGFCAAGHFFGCSTGSQQERSARTESMLPHSERWPRSIRPHASSLRHMGAWSNPLRGRSADWSAAARKPGWCCDGSGIR
jgi:hypothetical protein